jgi:hypothetical protein
MKIIQLCALHCVGVSKISLVRKILRSSIITERWQREKKNIFPAWVLSADEQASERARERERKSERETERERENR